MTQAQCSTPLRTYLYVRGSIDQSKVHADAQFGTERVVGEKQGEMEQKNLQRQSMAKI